MRNFRGALLWAAVCAVVVMGGCEARESGGKFNGDKLEAGFVSPPDTARPETWWHWMNGNVSKEGTTLDLEAMKRVGIVGAHLAQVGENIPKGPVAYDSPQMVECVKFAISEANRLGMELCMFNCPGWSSSGGPWIKPENSMKVLVFTEMTVEGGKRVSVGLKQAEGKLGFYRDAMVVAFPEDARDVKLAAFNNGLLKPGTKADAGLEGYVGGIDPGSVMNVTNRMDASGNLNWDAPAGKWTVMRIGFTTNGTQNHPGPEGGVGLEVDKFSKDALAAHFNAFFGPYFEAMKPLTAKGKFAALIDSYETGNQNWTDRFPEEFKKRRGYDLMKFMPAMVSGRVVGDVEETERFLWDVRKTEAELMDENYYGYFSELCHEHGMKAYTEPYDNGNFDEMVAGAYADMPMAEFWQDQANQRSIKLVASVMHMNGRPIMGAESFTSQSRWTEYPYGLKSLGDFMWTQGLNRFVFHRFAMQPNPTAVPGMTMGPWGGHFDRTNTWFEQGKAWLQYVARSQFLLQQGRFVGDLVYFAGEDSPVRNPDESALIPAPPEGHGFDTIDTVTMKKRVLISDGKIVLPDGLSYRAFVLPPGVKTMTLETMGRLHELVEEGMVLVVNGPRPVGTPSLGDVFKGDAALARMSADLWGDMDGVKVTEHAYGKGKVYWGEPLAEVLEGKMGVKKDFEETSRPGGAEVHYIHKRTEGAEIYFVANREQKSEDLVCTFNVAGKVPEIWDAGSGKHVDAAVYDFVEGRTRVPLQLSPAGSVFVVFRSTAPQTHDEIVRDANKVIAGTELLPDAGPSAGPTTRGSAYSIHALPKPLPKEDAPAAVELSGGPKGEMLAWRDGSYVLTDNTGKGRTVEVRGIGEPSDIGGPWAVSFPPNRGAPASATFDGLKSWSENAESGIKYFSGTATYTNQFTVDSSALEDGKRLFLDLGRVQVLAEVTVNGKNLGILWKLPFRVDVTDAVHAGKNDLEVKVTNLWPNRLIGDEQLPAENEYGPVNPRRSGTAIMKMPEWYVQGLPKPPGGRITFTTWRHWKGDDALLESGLIGPVLLRTAMPLSQSH